MDLEKKERIKRRKKKKRREFIKKMIPIVIAILLIIIVVGIYYGKTIFEKYSYSAERKDLYEYFEVIDDETVAIILNNEHIDEKGLLFDGVSYLDYDTVVKYFTGHFYANTVDDILLYTTATDIVKTNISENCFQYTVSGVPYEVGYSPAIKKGDTLYIAVEYLKLFCYMDVQTFYGPTRLVVYTEETSLNTAVTGRDTAARYQGGVKSPILEDLPEGTEIVVLEEMEDWAKVLTPEGTIGYTEIKCYESGSGKTISLSEPEIKLEYNPMSLEGKANVAFHQVFSQAANDSFDSYTKNTEGVNVIAPTWFRLLDDNGNTESIGSKEYVEKAANAGMDVWAVWTDVDYDVNLGNLLDSEEERASLITQMISSALDLGVKGINIDFESVKEDQGEHYVEFLRELSIETHRNKLILSVDNYVPTASTYHYNRAEQGMVADYVIIMGYDEHWGSSQTAGSVASIDFVENGILKTLEDVPAEKVINAIPFYTRIWKTENGSVSSEAIGMKDAAAWISENDVSMEWNGECCQNYGEFEKGGVLYQIWQEDSDSLKVKLEIMSNNNLGGVAEWKLGFEDSSIWSVINGTFVNR